jgi:hypothetical protein
MRKTQVALVVACAAAIGAAGGVTSAFGAGPAKISGTANVQATPTDQATPPSTKVKTVSVAVSGNVKSRAACRGGRVLEFTYVTPAGSYTLPGTVTSDRSGSYSITLPAPEGVTSKQNGTAVTVSVVARQQTRKDKATGEKVKCLEAVGIADFTDRT